MTSIAQTTLRSWLLAALAAAVLLATLLAGAGTEPAAASHLKQKCFPSGSKTVYRTSEGRFWTRGPVKADFGDTRPFYACSYRYGRSYRLRVSEFSEFDRYTRFRISGHFAGYVFNGVDCGACENSRARVRSLNLRTGRDRGYDATTLSDDPDERAHDLVLRRNGSIASIATGTEHDDETPPSATQVRALDASGLRTLDEDPGISLRSLELEGTTVSWVKDGVRKRATLR